MVMEKQGEQNGIIRANEKGGMGVGYEERKKIEEIVMEAERICSMLESVSDAITYSPNRIETYTPAINLIVELFYEHISSMRELNVIKSNS